MDGAPLPTQGAVVLTVYKSINNRTLTESPQPIRISCRFDRLFIRIAVVPANLFKLTACVPGSYPLRYRVIPILPREGNCLHGRYGLYPKMSA